MYADGLTPPMRNVVRRKFHRASPPWGKFIKTEVQDVEDQVLRLIQINEAKNDNCIETVYEETVKLEPWMIDQDAAKTGRISGITLEINPSVLSGGGIDEDKDKLFGYEVLMRHPELLLSYYDFPTVLSSMSKELDDSKSDCNFAFSTDGGGLYVPEGQEEDLDMELFGDLGTKGFLPSTDAQI